MDYSYQNKGQNNDDEVGKDTQAKRHRMESDLLILKSDFSKNERTRSDLEMEITQMKKKITQIGLDIETKEEELKKMENEQRMLGEDIKRVTKKLKFL